MRAALAVLLAVAGCGRLGFDAVAVGDGALTDGGGLVGPPLMAVDPRTLPPFGTPVLVSISEVGIDDDDACLTRDQLEIFYDSSRDGGSDLWTARRATIADPWGPIEKLVTLDTNANEEHPSLSGDALTLYFTSGRGTNAGDLYVSTRDDRTSVWKPPVRLDVLDSSENDQMGGVNATQTIMVFSSTRGALPQDDQFGTQRSSPQAAWDPPTKILEISTPSDDQGGFLDDYGLALFTEHGSRIEWYRRATVDDPWATPSTQLSELVVAGTALSDPWLSPDLRTIYFTRDTGPGTKDVYMATR